MSWAEVKIINSDLTTPINIAYLINYIDLYGTNYVGASDINTTINLLRAGGLYSHGVATTIVSKSFWDYINNATSNAGSLIGSAFGINNSTLNSYNTLTQIKSNADTMFLLGQNYRLQQSLMTYPTMYASIGASAGFARAMFYNSQLCNWTINATTDPYFLPVKNFRGLSDLNTNRIILSTVGSSTYTVPANTYGIYVVQISGGGGGGTAGGSYSTTNGAAGGGDGGSGGIAYSSAVGGGAGGGGAGSYKVKYLSVTPGQVISYTVGAGGAIKGVGGTSSFYDTNGVKYYSNQDYIIPSISTGGKSYQNADPYNGQSGGGNGGNGHSNSLGGGGAGGYGGGNGTAANGSYAYGGGGGGGYGGGGGGGGTNSGSGTMSGGTGGATYGTGGGGLAGANSYNYNGGPGGQGVIVLYLGKSTLA